MVVLLKRVRLPKHWHDEKISSPVKEGIDAIKTHILRSIETDKSFNLQSKIKSGIRILFDGPSKKEKVYAAIYLSKSVGKDLYRIDLSSVVSKYIGETEKNLAELFDNVANKDWILLFDEADALFSKRTNVKDAHDRYANQEISYLLQRIEEYQGMVVLASNFKENIDDAFLRKCAFIVNFPIDK